MPLFKKPEEPAAPPVVTPPVATPPAGDFVTKADLNAFGTLLDTKLAQIADTFAQGMNRPVVVQQTQAQVHEPEITDEEIDAALAEGKGGAARVRQLLTRSIGKAKAELLAEVDAIKDYGTTMLGTLAERTALSLPHFKTYEKEIRQLVAGCDPAHRGHPDTWKTAYETVIGRHHEEIKTAEIQAALRKQTEDEEVNAQAGLPGAKGAQNRSQGEDDVPSFAEMAGTFEGASNIDEEDFIRRLNRSMASGDRYKDWPDYVKRGQAVENEMQAMKHGSARLN